jgi:hypothetical protein
MRITRHLTTLLLLTPIPTFRFGAAAAAGGDPPARVGRVSYLSGAVSFRPGSVDDWTAARINYPLTGGDHLWTDADARAEVTLGSTALRLAPYTGFAFLALDDHTTQVRLTEGSLQLRIRSLDDNDSFEIDTPTGAVSLLRPGAYRVDVDSGGDTMTVTVREGRAEVTAAGSAFPVEAGQAASVAGTEAPSYDVHAAAGSDDFEAWAALRDRRHDEAVSAHYVSREMIGYEDLDDNGAWRVADAYGPVWVPRAVPVGWAPYRFGHWAWVEPWGWTWIDDAPWGFAPFHYGRWVYLDGWAWVPGRIVARPVYAPALVAFVGGSNWSISLFAGDGGGVAWFPLAPDEVYVPAYRVTRTYVRNVNVTNVNVTNINVTNVNVTNVRYVNRDAPGGVTAVSRETFVGARPVGQGVVIVSRERLRETSVTTTAAVAPRRESVLAGELSAGAVPRPPAALATRRVVTRAAPPPPPVPFTAGQRAREANPGRPLDDRTVTALRGRMVATPTNPDVRPPTRPAPGAAPALKPARVDLPPPRPVEPAPVAPRASDRPPPPPSPARDQLDTRHAAELDQLERRHQAELQQQPPRGPDPAVKQRLAAEDRALAAQQQRERDAMQRRVPSPRPSQEPKPKEAPKDQRAKPKDKPRPGGERLR